MSIPIYYRKTVSDTKYFYNNKTNTVYMVENCNDSLKHFDFKLPFELPKINLPTIKLPDIKNPFDSKNNSNKNTKDSSKISISKNSNGGKKGREWKNHKWIARKRNKDGKWIYDYGDGFPDEKKLGSNKRVRINPDNDIKLNAPSKLAKNLLAVANLGQTLSSPDIASKVQAGKRFLGNLSEGVRTLEANALKFGTEKDSNGLSLKHDDRGKEFDLTHVNPGWENDDGASQQNCVPCSVAYDMRRRGYEVTAKEHSTGLSYNNSVSFYKDPDIHQVTSDTNKVRIENNMYKNDGLTSEVEKAMSSEPNNTRGIAILEWYPAGSGGHAVAYEKENGNVTLYDAQSGEKVNISEYTDHANTFLYYRTDNLEPNYEQIKKVVE